MIASHLFRPGLYGLLLVLVLTGTRVAAQDSGWFPFTIPWNDTSHSEIDLRSLNDHPAGERGFPHVNAKGHIYFDKTPNQEERFWGVQLAGAAQHPTHAESDLIAGHLAKMGFNLWKPGGLELTWNTSGFTSIGDKNERIDRFDYLYSQMKQNGLYFYFQIGDYGVARAFADAKSNYSNEVKQLAAQKTIFYEYLLDNEVWQAQLAYWSELFNHKNPYTGLAYKDDPAIPIVEITNEEYIVDGWLGGRFHENMFPPRFAALLTSKWNNWLKGKYGTIDALERNWQPSAGEAAQLGMLAFEPVKPYMSGYSISRQEDIIAFLTSLQTAYFDTVATTLKRMGVHGLFNAGQSIELSAPNPAIYSASKMDVMDYHSYFDNTPLIGPTGAILNTNPFTYPVTGNKYFAGGGPCGLTAASAVYGKPMFLTEINWSYPNEHQYLFIPQLVANASHQDWDGLILHAYALQIPWDSINYIETQLILRNNPVVMAECIAGAIAFRTKAIAPAAETVVLHYSPSSLSTDLYNSMGPASDNLPRVPCFPAGSGSKARIRFPASLSLVHEIRKSFDGGESSPDSVSGPVYTTDTHQIVFNTTAELMTVSTPRILSAGGKVGTATVLDPLSKTSLNVEFSGDAYLNVAMVPLDGQTLSNSEKLLVTIASQVQNSGVVWKEQYKSATVWGKGPVLVKGQDGHVGISGVRSASYDVWALTASGSKTKKITGPVGSTTTIDFDVRADDRTLWYLVEKTGN